MYRTSPELETVDKYGRRQVRWVHWRTLRARASDVSGKDYFDAAAYQMQDTVTFTTRWIEGITTAMRILWEGKVYVIDQINHLGYRRDFIRIQARMVDPDGGNIYGEP